MRCQPVTGHNKSLWSSNSHSSGLPLPCPSLNDHVLELIEIFFLFFIEGDGSPQSPFRQILPKCKLARDLKEAYDRCVVGHFIIFVSPVLTHSMICVYTAGNVCFFCSLCTTGVMQLHINSWLEVSFCLPHKIHRIGGNHIPPEALERSLKAIRCHYSFYVKGSEQEKGEAT